MSRKRSLYRSAARTLTGCGPAGWHRTNDACRARPGENANACPGVGVRTGKPLDEENLCEKRAQQVRPPHFT